MKQIKLIDYDQPFITKGSILRFFTKGFQVETTVDFMVFYPADKNCGLGLITITGFNAGDIYIILPEESLYSTQHTLSTEWLVNNWNKWICEASDVKDVYFIKSYPDAA